MAPGSDPQSSGSGNGSEMKPLLANNPNPNANILGNAAKNAEYKIATNLSEENGLPGVNADGEKQSITYQTGAALDHFIDCLTKVWGKFSEKALNDGANPDEKLTAENLGYDPEDTPEWITQFITEANELNGFVGELKNATTDQEKDEALKKIKNKLAALARIYQSSMSHCQSTVHHYKLFKLMLNTLTVMQQYVEQYWRLNHTVRSSEQANGKTLRKTGITDQQIRDFFEVTPDQHPQHKIDGETEMRMPLDAIKVDPATKQESLLELPEKTTRKELEHAISEINAQRIKNKKAPLKATFGNQISKGEKRWAGFKTFLKIMALCFFTPILPDRWNHQIGESMIASAHLPDPDDPRSFTISGNSESERAENYQEIIRKVRELRNKKSDPDSMEMKARANDNDDDDKNQTPAAADVCDQKHGGPAIITPSGGP